MQLWFETTLEWGRQRPRGGTVYFAAGVWPLRANRKFVQGVIPGYELSGRGFLLNIKTKLEANVNCAH